MIMSKEIDNFIGTLYHPKYLISMKDFTINCYMHHNDGESDEDIAKHSGSCYGYAIFLNQRTHIDLFLGNTTRFKNFGKYTELESGYSRIVFNNGTELIFDPEGYAGDGSVEQLIGLYDELEMI